MERNKDLGKLKMVRQLTVITRKHQIISDFDFSKNRNVKYLRMYLIWLELTSDFRHGRGLEFVFSITSRFAAIRTNNG